MAKTPRKTYLLSLALAAMVTLLLVSLNGVFLFFLGVEILNYGYRPIILFSFFVFIVCFFIFAYRIESHTYKQIRDIYKDLAPQFSGELNDILITDDMDSLLKNVRELALSRNVEINTLKDQEVFRREFLGNVAHELKTPLFTVQGYIHTLIDGAMKDAAVNKKYLNRASKGVERLIYIVKDLDLLTNLETGNSELEMEPFDILDLIQNVVDMLEMQASKSNIKIEFDRKNEGPVMVFGDRERIQQVLTNLMMNSIKYGKLKGTTEIDVEPIYASKVIVRVRDNGEGISEEHLPRLFERFYRVDKSGSRRTGGSGLGLAIVKHIIEAHGEQIFVESQPEIGSEFSFTLEKHDTTVSVS